MHVRNLHVDKLKIFECHICKKIEVDATLLTNHIVFNCFQHFLNKNGADKTSESLNSASTIISVQKDYTPSITIGVQKDYTAANTTSRHKDYTAPTKTCLQKDYTAVSSTTVQKDCTAASTTIDVLKDCTTFTTTGRQKDYTASTKTSVKKNNTVSTATNVQKDFITSPTTVRIQKYYIDSTTNMQNDFSFDRKEISNEAVKHSNEMCRPRESFYRVLRELQIYCPICSRSYITNDDLKLHILKRHVKKLSIFECNFCGKMECNEIEFTSHLMTHTFSHNNKKSNETNSASLQINSVDDVISDITKKKRFFKIQQMSARRKRVTCNLSNKKKLVNGTEKPNDQDENMKHVGSTLNKHMKTNIAAVQETTKGTVDSPSKSLNVITSQNETFINMTPELLIARLPEKEPSLEKNLSDTANKVLCCEEPGNNLILNLNELDSTTIVNRYTSVNPYASPKPREFDCIMRVKQTSNKPVMLKATENRSLPKGKVSNAIDMPSATEKELSSKTNKHSHTITFTKIDNTKCLPRESLFLNQNENQSLHKDKPVKINTGSHSKNADNRRDVFEKSVPEVKDSNNTNECNELNGNVTVKAKPDESLMCNIIEMQHFQESKFNIIDSYSEGSNNNTILIEEDTSIDWTTGNINDEEDEPIVLYMKGNNDIFKEVLEKIKTEEAEEKNSKINKAQLKNKNSSFPGNNFFARTSSNLDELNETIGTTKLEIDASLSESQLLDREKYDNVNPGLPQPGTSHIKAEMMFENNAILPDEEVYYGINRSPSPDAYDGLIITVKKEKQESSMLNLMENNSLSKEISEMINEEELKEKNSKINKAQLKKKTSRITKSSHAEVSNREAPVMTGKCSSVTGELFSGGSNKCSEYEPQKYILTVKAETDEPYCSRKLSEKTNEDSHSEGPDDNVMILYEKNTCVKHLEETVEVIAELKHCTMCSASFPTLYELMQHVRAHI